MFAVHPGRFSPFFRSQNVYIIHVSEAKIKIDRPDCLKIHTGERLLSTAFLHACISVFTALTTSRGLLYVLFIILFFTVNKSSLIAKTSARN